MPGIHTRCETFFTACEEKLKHVTDSAGQLNYTRALQALTAVSSLQKTHKLYRSTIASYITGIAIKGSTSDNTIGALRHITKIIHMARNLGVSDFSYYIAGTAQKYDGANRITSGEGFSITINPGDHPKVVYSGSNVLANRVNTVAIPNVSKLNIDEYAAEIVTALKSFELTHIRLDIEPPRPYLNNGLRDFYSWAYSPNAFGADDEYEYSQELQHVGRLLQGLNANQESKLVSRLALNQEDYAFWPVSALQYTDREDFYRTYGEVIKK